VKRNSLPSELPPIEPDLITAYQARVVALAANFLVALLAAGPRSPHEVGAARRGLDGRGSQSNRYSIETGEIGGNRHRKGDGSEQRTSTYGGPSP
jgi:hypothetical protein